MDRNVIENGTITHNDYQLFDGSIWYRPSILVTTIESGDKIVFKYNNVGSSGIIIFWSVNSTFPNWDVIKNRSTNWIKVSNDEITFADITPSLGGGGQSGGAVRKNNFLQGCGFELNDNRVSFHVPLDQNSFNIYSYNNRYKVKRISHYDQQQNNRHTITASDKVYIHIYSSGSENLSIEWKKSTIWTTTHKTLDDKKAELVATKAAKAELEASKNQEIADKNQEIADKKKAHQKNVKIIGITATIIGAGVGGSITYIVSKKNHLGFH